MHTTITTEIRFSVEAIRLSTVRIQCGSFTMEPRINAGKIPVTIEGIKIDLDLSNDTVTIKGPCHVSRDIVGSTLVLTLKLMSEELNFIESHRYFAMLAQRPGGILGNQMDFDSGGCSLRDLSNCYAHTKEIPPPHFIEESTTPYKERSFLIRSLH